MTNMSYGRFFGKTTRISKEDQEFYDLKHRAAEYYTVNGVPQKFEAALNCMFFEQPDDVYGYLANYFSRLSTRPVISKLKGSKVYDGKGQLTVQTEVLCTVRNEEKRVCSAVTSSECNLTINESDKREDCVTAALHWIDEALSTMLRGFDPADQTAVDKLLSDFFKEHFLEYQERQSRETEEKQAADPVYEPAPPPVTPGHRKAGHKEPQVPIIPGSMAIGCVSLAIAKAAAQLNSVPLYQHIRSLHPQQQGLGNVEMPLPMITLLHCGKASPGKLNLMEELIVIPTAKRSVRQIVAMVLELQKEITKMLNTASKTGPVLNTVSDMGAMVVGYDQPEQPLDLLTEAANNLGLTPGDDIHFAINCAAHELMDYQKGKYDVVSGSAKTPDELVDMYKHLMHRYPALIALIDPLRKKDHEQWQSLCRALRPTCHLLCDTTFSPTTALLTEGTLSTPGARGYILKQTNQTTVTDLIQVTQQLKGVVTILGTTSGEPCCDTLSDLAVGLGVNFVKLGGLSRGERLTKYNRLISIEEELSQQGILGMAFSVSVLSVCRKASGQSAGCRDRNWPVAENASLLVYEKNSVSGIIRKGSVWMRLGSLNWPPNYT
ncbi:enolase 4 isoform X3 [Brienomyrus brachyistius]|uniref:enolase 4 isoform X3 n=1 Tax=Brienomyrus brachyistius TaxID=42636 RepID=UPI0020B38E88|nr:enolase 4 isoform X3 [Brienomyrus brachyistius]